MHITLSLNNISKSFGENTIYHDIFFEFKPGCYVITGKNGVGKSVLLEILAGVLPQDKGSVTLNGIGDSSTINYKRNLTYVPGKPMFFPSATGEDYLSFIYAVKKKTVNNEKFTATAEGFRVNEFLKTKFNDMSLGSQKKLFLTTVGMSNSRLIIMDEPSNALDDKSNKFLTQMIIENSINNIVIVATHDKDLIANINPALIELKSTPIYQLDIKKVGNATKIP